MDENLIGCATLPLQALLVGPANYCSPCHRMSFNSRNEGSNAVKDILSNFCKILGGGRPRRRAGRVAGGTAWRILLATS